MLTMDDSGSMGWDFLPDFVAYPGSGIYHCRDTSATVMASPIAAEPRAAPTSGYTFSLYDPPVRSSDYNDAFYDRTVHLYPGQEGRWHEPSVPGFGHHLRVAVDRRLRRWIRRLSGCEQRNHDQSDDRLSGHDLVLEDQPLRPPRRTTADGNGSVCRRNGRVLQPWSDRSSGTTTPAIAAGYNYPNSSATCSGSQKCKFINPFTVNGSPYYYTISQVQLLFGQGHRTAGEPPPAPPDWDPTTYKYVRYGTGAATFDPQAFTRIDIKSTGFLVNGVSGANPSGRTYAQEMQNFALWYSFYRTRIQMMQAASGIAFSALDQNSRVGYHTLHENDNPGSLFLNIVDFTTANKLTWFTKLYATTPNGGTNLAGRGMAHRRTLFRKFGGHGSPRRHRPARPVDGKVPAELPPDVDGRLLELDAGRYTSRGDNDRTVPALANLPGATGFTVGVELPAAVLRGTDDDQRQRCGPRHVLLDPRHPSHRRRQSERRDRALAARHHVRPVHRRQRHGQLIRTASTTSRAAPRIGCRPPERAGRRPIDDLWHGSINTRGKFFNASNAQQLAESIVSALADFTDQAGTGAGVGLGGAQLQRHQPVRIQDELRSRLVGRRQEVCDRHHHRCASRRRQRQSASLRRCGRLRRNWTRRRLSWARSTAGIRAAGS